MRFLQLSTRLRLAGILCALLLPTLARAQVAVNATVSFDAGTSLYTYDYSVVNGSANDLLYVEIPVLADPTAVQSLVAPGDYQAVFDSNLGLLDFLPGLGVTGFDPGTTTDGFVLVSSFGPKAATFSALDSQVNSFTGSTLSPTGVPEPGVTALGLTALMSGLGLGLRSFRLARKRA